MKNKDIATLREDNTDLEQRLTTKTSELRSLKTQLQVTQSRYEECQSELDNLQSGNFKKAERTQSSRAYKV